MQNKIENIHNNTHRFSHNAMATIFEIVIYSEEKDYAQQSATEAFLELDRLEQELSRFIENSDVARINNLAANKSLRIGLDAFKCLQQCSKLYQQTNGLFDITIGSLMKCWLNEDKSFRNPSDEEIEFARQRTGMHLIKLDEPEHTVELSVSPIIIDLGGFGKGYAVDQMAELLREWSINTFLIHGGQSSVFASGAPQAENGWSVSITNPFNSQKPSDEILLTNQALSSSGLQKGQHIINPVTTKPVQKNIAAWAMAPTAALSDALSTTFMLMAPGEIDQFCSSHPGIKALLVFEGKNQMLRFGFK